MQQDVFKRPKVSLQGLLLLFVAVLVGGIVIGGVTSFIGRFIYLILVFPALMGLAAGLILKSIVVSQKIRSPLVVVAAGVFSAILIFASMHYFDYLKFRSDGAREIQAQVVAEYGEPAADEDVEAYIDYILVEETGFPGFPGFFLLEAREGVSISEVGPASGSRSPLNLGMFTWVYWLVELVFIGGAAIGTAYGKSKEMFCEHCDAWVPEGDHIGGLQPEAIDRAVELIKRRDFAGLAQLLRIDTTLPSVEFYTRTCRTCTTFPFYLTAFVISPGRQGQTQSKQLMVQTLTSSERFALTSALNALPAEGNSQ